MNRRFKRRIVGTPLATEDEQRQRLAIPIALAVLASDAIWSDSQRSDGEGVQRLRDQGIAALADAPPLFRNLDVIRVD